MLGLRPSPRKGRLAPLHFSSRACSTIEVAYFRNFFFLNYGVPQPKVVGMPIMFRKITFLYTWGHGIIDRDAI